MVIVNDAGEILLIRRTDNGNWAFPGGVPALWPIRLADEAQGGGHLQTEPSGMHGFAGESLVDALEQQCRVFLVHHA